MNYFGINLKKLLLKEGLSENEFSKRIGISQQIINRIVTGVNQNPKLATLTPIADYFKIPLQELITNANLDANPAMLQTMQIPFVSFKEFETLGVQDALAHSKKLIAVDLQPNKQYFAITMNDDSMEPKFSSNTLLVFEREKQPVHGDFCLVQTADKHYLVRQIMLQSAEKKFMKCLNPNWDGFTATPLPVDSRILATLLEARMFF